MPGLVVKFSILLEASHQAGQDPYFTHPKPTEQQAQHVQESINPGAKCRADAVCDTAS